MSNPGFDQEGWPLSGYPPSPCVDYFGRFRSHGRFRWEQISNRYCIHLIESGRGYFEIETGRFAAGEGDAFLFYPGMHVRYYDIETMPWRYSWAGLSGSNIDTLMEDLGFQRENPLLCGVVTPSLKNYCRELGFQLKNGHHTPFLAQAAFWQIMHFLGIETKIKRSGREADLRQLTRRLLDNSFGDVPTVEWLAERFRLSRSQLFRIFKTHYGISPKAFIDQIRFERAQDLLKNSRMSIKEIATACGFSSGDYFTTAFRERYGQSPMSWRRKNQ
ncbi:MAG: AraC family transcriptional regulator [Lentisphaerae bacterium]|nr:MAG: AraC family transcriptional regulator [Lentisphaerota bacterium]